MAIAATIGRREPDCGRLWPRRAATTVCVAVLAAAAAASERAAEHVFRDAVIREEQGGVIRGDVNAKRLALIFTGDEFADSAVPILDELKQRKLQAGFFITGNFARNESLRPVIERMVAEGHYVGPHSDRHPLYCDWDDRSKSLITRELFHSDLQKNMDALQAAGAATGRHSTLFVPPYEWYNAKHVDWAEELGVKLINFTPGSGSNRDYAREGDPRFCSSQKILEDILAYEQKDLHGLNGFLLLLHLGSGRKDPFHSRLGELLDALRGRAYEVVRVDQLLLDE